MRKVMVLEDESSIRSFIVINLRRAGYEVVEAETGEEALDKLHANPDTLVALLDVMLPKLDGFTVLRRLRAEGSTTPVLMLTARSELTDRVNGLDSGADYYLTKPFEPKELLACIRALTRRQPELRQTDALKYGDLRLEKTSFTLSCGERSVRLSRKEFDMMEMLMLNQKLVITKEKLLLKVWGYESDAEDNNVEVYISFLRKKLDHLHSQVKIRTIRMVGYCLEAPEEA